MNIDTHCSARDRPGGPSATDCLGPAEFAKLVAEVEQLLRADQMTELQPYLPQGHRARKQGGDVTTPEFAEFLVGFICERLGRR